MMPNNGFFLQGEGQVIDNLGGFLAGLVALGDFHQGDQIRGIPPVHAAETLGLFHGLCNIRDPQAGGVGGQDGGLGDKFADCAEKVLFYGQILGDVFHHEVGGFVDGEIGGVLDAPGDGVYGLGQAALVPEDGQVVGDALPSLVQGDLAAVPEGDGAAALGKEPGEGDAHGARASHHHGANISVQHRNSSLLLKVRLGLEYHRREKESTARRKTWPLFV